MRVLLIHNPDAGAQDGSGGELVRLLEAAGHTVDPHDLLEQRWPDALDTPLDAVVVAGGDGTVRTVILALAEAGRNVPLAMLPEGTANNLARSFGPPAAAAELIPRLERLEARHFTVGRITGPWGESAFVEAAGVGIFAQMLREEHLHPDPQQPRGDKLRAGCAHLSQVLEREAPRQLRVEVDGRDLSGDYWLAEAMNIPSIGARLELAPLADPGDDCLDLVLVGRAEQPLFAEYLGKLSRGEPARMPDVSVRASRIVLGWPDDDGHVDDQPWPDGPHEDTIVELVIAASIPVLVGETA